jgi:8-oxo-dGTP diphosphatase
MKKYCLGFVFDSTTKRVALVEKTSGWQTGLFNGVGGKIERGEEPFDAMRREGKEELGVDITWKQFGSIHGGGWVVWLFRGINTDNLMYNGVTDAYEKIVEVEISSLNYGNTIPNLRYLIPLALDSGIENVVIIDRGYGE